MRVVIAIVMAVATTAAAEPCKDPMACEKACSARDTHACTVAAEALFDGKHGAPFDPKRSLPLAKTACDAGDAYGCALLGYHYQDGSGTAYAPELAVAAYDKACRGGAGVGCYNLAGMYSGGHGVVVDRDKSDSYIERARKAWNASCDGTDTRWCSNAGFLLEDKDRAAAEVRYRRGCDHGDAIACVQVARVGVQSGKLKPDAFIAEVDRLCTSGELVACGLEANYLWYGENGVTADHKRAFAIGKRACDMNDAPSCVLVGAAYAGGNIVPTDGPAADRYMNLACERRLAKACLMRAKALNSSGDRAGAKPYLQRACEMNDGESCSALAIVTKGTPDEPHWATEACRRGFGEDCRTLIDLGRDLPVPAQTKARLYKEACSEGHKLACSHH
jgi:hypothetical protein